MGSSFLNGIFSLANAIRDSGLIQRLQAAFSVSIDLSTSVFFHKTDRCEGFLDAMHCVDLSPRTFQSPKFFAFCSLESRQIQCQT